MPDGTIVEMPDQLDPALGARLRAFHAAQGTPPAPRKPQDGNPVTGKVPSGFHAVTGEGGQQTLRRNFGLRDIAQSVLDLPGVGTAANAAVGAYNTGVKALSGLIGLGGGDVEKTREALSVEPAQTRDPVTQALGVAQRGAEAVTKPLDDVVASLPPGPQTAIEAGAEAATDILGLAGARAPLEGLAAAAKTARTPVKAPGAPARTPVEVADAAGFKLTEAERGSGVLKRTGEKLAGRSARETKNQEFNQTRRNELAAEDMGLPKGTALSKKAFEKAEEPHAAVYDEVRAALPSVTLDDQFRSAMGGKGGRKSDVAEAPAVRKLKEQFAELDKTDGESILNTISELRRDARTERRSDRVSIQRRGEARDQIADAYEDLLERNLETLNPGLTQKYRNARKGFATVRTYRDATVGQNVDASKLARATAKSKGISGGARVIAEQYENFPKSQKLGQKIHEAGGSSLAADVVSHGARPAARKLLDVMNPSRPNKQALSDYYRSPEAPTAPAAPRSRMGSGSVDFTPTPGVAPVRSLASDLELAPEPVPNAQVLPEAPPTLTADVPPPIRGDIDFQASPELINVLDELGLAPRPGDGVPYDLEYAPPNVAAAQAPELSLLTDLADQLGLRVDTPQPPPMTLEPSAGRVGKPKKPKAKK